MPNFRRFLSRRWLFGFAGLTALLFGLAMLHPYPRQSLFGPKLGGVPMCVWEDRVAQSAHNKKTDDEISTKLWVWLGGSTKLPDLTEEGVDRLCIELLTHRDPAVRLLVLEGFLSRESLHEPFVLPDLRRCLHDACPKNRLMAALAIWSVHQDPEGLRAIESVLRDPDAKTREFAMSRLRMFTKCSPEELPIIEVCARDPADEVRYQAIWALRKFGKKALPSMTNGLDDKSLDVREAAVHGVWQLGPEAKEAIPALQRRLHDESFKIRGDAAQALRDIDPERFLPVKPPD